MNRCSMCGAEGSRSFATFDSFRKKKFIIRICDGCGTGWLDPMLSFPEVEKRYYAESYHAYQSEGKAGFFRKAKDRIKSAVLETYLGYGAPSLFGRIMKPFFYRLAFYPKKVEKGTYLDVGCGSGVQLLHMKQLGWEVYGVDYSARAIAIARENGLEHLSHGGLADARFPDGTFDVINFTHVVEHIPDVGSVFDEARRILKPSGELIVSVPHFNGLYRRIFGAHADYDVPRHVYQFTLPGMRRLLEEHGFEISEYYVNDIMRGVAHAASFSLGANRKVTWCLLAPALLVDLAIEPFLCHTELGAQLIVKAKKKTAHAAA